MLSIRFTFSLFFLILLISCSQKPCEEIEENFRSYKEAKSKIESADFTFNDKVNTSKSSWIKRASFYSCNGKEGYFILETKQKSYIFKNLPIAIWQEFKKADSFGTYYSNYIRGKYILLLEE